MVRIVFSSFLACGALWLEQGCHPSKPVEAPQNAVSGSPRDVRSDPVNGPGESPSQPSIAEFFEAADQEIASRSPMTLGRRGIKEKMDQWDDLSEAWGQETAAIRRRHLAELDGYDEATLDPADRLSARLFRHEWQMELEAFEFRFHDYPINQMRGLHEAVITHLTNIHSIESKADAHAYLARLDRIPVYLVQLQRRVERQADLGIVAPKFTFPMSIEVAEAVMAGTPLGRSREENVLYADFKRKVIALDLPNADTEALLARAEAALRTSVVPAFESLAEFQRGLSERAEIRGVWALPNGDSYYRHRLRRFTTTDMTPDEVHDLGLSEVERLHAEIRQVMKKLGFRGSLQAFFRYTLESPRFYYPNTMAGKARVVADATALVEGIKVDLDKLFLTLPKADVVVRAVEPYRAKSAGAAFYRRGSPDGSRPGIYYLNTYDTRDIPRWEMAALAYHEAIPGHHMQRSIGQEMESLPAFRRFVRYEAYTEGWGLYAEWLPKEIGYYEDPYDDYGRLAMELRRACRLVVDTGLHHKRWSTEQAIEYMVQNMPNTRHRARRSVYRYLVMAGQATAYKIGALKIQSLRETAQEKLGPRFDLRRFHDVILRNSQVPLPVLEDLVRAWVDAELG